jgi:hypothetical protein
LSHRWRRVGLVQFALEGSMRRIPHRRFGSVSSNPVGDEQRKQRVAGQVRGQRRPEGGGRVCALGWNRGGRRRRGSGGRRGSGELQGRVGRGAPSGVLSHRIGHVTDPFD